MAGCNGRGTCTEHCNRCNREVDTEEIAACPYDDCELQTFNFNPDDLYKELDFSSTNLPAVETESNWEEEMALELYEEFLAAELDEDIPWTDEDEYSSV